MFLHSKKIREIRQKRTFCTPVFLVPMYFLISNNVYSKQANCQEKFEEIVM